jgi:hypothetical protein
LKPELVFHDKANAHNLKDLPKEVMQSKCLLVLQTKDVLTRPFCLIEIYTAIKNNIPIVPVELIGLGYDHAETINLVENTDSFEEKLEKRNPGAGKTLEGQGIDLKDLATVLKSKVSLFVSEKYDSSFKAGVLASMISGIVDTSLDEINKPT